MNEETNVRKQVEQQVENFLKDVNYINFDEKDKEQIINIFLLLALEEKLTVDELSFLNYFFDVIPDYEKIRLKDNKELFYYTLTIVMTSACSLKSFKIKHKNVF